MVRLFPHRSNRRLLLPVAALGWLIFSHAPSIPNACATESLGPNPEPLWMRYPALSSDGKTIAFSFQGHLFLVPTEGGIAHPLTAGPAHDTAPVWSRDGKFIAFASDRYGHYDLYLVSVEGGQARRLTTYSNNAIPSTFTPDGKFVVFSEHRRVSAKTSRIPISRFSELYKVSVDGGREPEMILPTPALNAQFDRVDASFTTIKRATKIFGASTSLPLSPMTSGCLM
jgi:tricorn protease